MLLIRHWRCGNSAVLLTESEFLLILQRGKPRRRTEIVITGKCILPLWGEGIRRDTVPADAAPAVFHPLFIAIPWIQCLFFSRPGLEGCNTIGQLPADYISYLPSLHRVISFQPRFLPRGKQKKFLSSLAPPPRACVFIFRIVGLATRKKRGRTAIYFNGETPPRVWR